MSLSTDVLTNNITPRLQLNQKSIPVTQNNLLLGLGDTSKNYIYSSPGSQPSWNSLVTIPILDQGYIMHRSFVIFTVSQLTGTAATTSSLAPACFFAPRITIESTSKTLQTLLSPHQFIMTNLGLLNDQQRNLVNIGMGNYADTPTRILLAQNATSMYICPLFSFIEASDDYVHTGNPNHNLTFKLQMNSIQNLIVPYGAAATCNLMSVQVMSEISRTNLIPRTLAMTKTKEWFNFNDQKIITSIIPSGSNSFSQQLTIASNCSHLYFFVQPSSIAGLGEGNYSQMIPVQSYTVYNSRNEPLVVKNTSLDSRIFQYALCKSVTESNLTIENSTTKYIYAMNFSNDLKKILQYGGLCGSVTLTSLENLVVNFPTSTTQQMTITTVLCFENAIIQSSQETNQILVTC